MVNTRAATDPADLDPDLLITRIQNSRSGSVKKIVLPKFSSEIRGFKICSEMFDKIFSLKAVLNLFMKISSCLKNCKRNRLKIMHFRVFLTNEKIFRLLTDPNPDPDLSLPGPGSNFSDPWQL